MRTNIARQKGTRKPPRVGDIFGILVPGKGWLFGRLIHDNVRIFDGALLIYVYNVLQDSPSPIPRLHKESLLVPPLLVGRLSWTLGYFVHLSHAPLQPGDAFPRHCFESYSGYFNEKAESVDRFEPCGDWGFNQIGAIDNLVSTALGLTPIPDDEKFPPSPRRPRKRPPRGPGGLTLYLPLRPLGKRGVERIEAALRAAVERAGAGGWEGHGFDLDRKVFDCRFQTKDLKQLVDVVRQQVTALGHELPPGWRLTIRRGDHGDDEPLTF